MADRRVQPVNAAGLGAHMGRLCADDLAQRAERRQVVYPEPRVGGTGSTGRTDGALVQWAVYAVHPLRRAVSGAVRCALLHAV